MRFFNTSVVALFISAICFLMSFSLSDNKKVNETITAMARDCQQHIEGLGQLVYQKAQWGEDSQVLKRKIKETRLQYKRVEFLLEYYYPKHVKAYINGAPLDHVDPYPYIEDYSDDYYPGGAEAYMNSRPLDYLEGGHYQAEPRVVAPQGLQVLDEMIFGSDEPNQEELILLVNSLNQKFSTLVDALILRSHFQQFEIIEACRLELIRIFSLGVTGFDTPGSLNALNESRVALEGMHSVFKISFEETSGRRAVEKKFNQAIDFLKRDVTFEGFDRMAFLKDYVDPLYKELKDFHQTLHLPTSASLEIGEHSWNFNSSSIFAEDLLNPYYYGMLPRGDDTPELRQLGERLFFEKQLSRSGKLSCASCHKPELAFSDGRPLSHSSVEGKSVKRNSPGLINAVFADRFFYDLRAYDLPDQAAHVIESHLEFNTSMDEIIHKLNTSEEYLGHFKTSFGGEGEITHDQFSRALAAYVMSLKSYQSPFDQYVRGERKKINPEVIAGFNLFMGKAACGTCHFAPTFSGLVPPLFQENESEVLGVLRKPESFEIDDDPGRRGNGILQENFEIYNNSFKTTTVRNIALTAPYFHNGAYPDLESVLNFYNHGGAAGIGLSYELPNQTLPPDSLHLSDIEKSQMISFLESLTDSVGVDAFTKQ